MKYFYDTEFLEDGKTIELISIGIVAEDGREYYAVSSEMPWNRICKHEWLMQNVVPQLGDERKSRATIRDEVSDFLFPVQKTLLGIVNRGLPELWAWFGSYDHVVLAQLFGTMMDFPNHVPMWTNDLRQEQHRRGNPGLPEQPEGLHNALADAKHLKLRYEYLHKKVTPRG